MAIKNWWNRRKLDKLKGVEALDHGIVRGAGIPHPERWTQKKEIRYWQSMSEKGAHDFYMSLPTVQENPRLKSIVEFQKWNARRRNLIYNAERDFRLKYGIPGDVDLSQAEQNKLNEFTRQRVQQLIDQPGMTI